MSEETLEVQENSELMKKQVGITLKFEYKNDAYDNVHYSEKSFSGTASEVKAWAMSFVESGKEGDPSNLKVNPVVVFDSGEEVPYEEFLVMNFSQIAEK